MTTRRIVAANKLYQAFENGGHRDDWEIKHKCARSWCRRCYKAHTIFISPDWSPEDWDQQGGIEGLIKSAAEPDRPKIKRVSKLQKRLDTLADVVRKLQWNDGRWSTIGIAV